MPKLLKYKQSSTLPYIVKDDDGETVCFSQTKAELVTRALNVLHESPEIISKIEHICRQIERDADEPDMIMKYAELVQQQISLMKSFVCDGVESQ